MDRCMQAIRTWLGTTCAHVVDTHTCILVRALRLQPTTPIHHQSHPNHPSPPPVPINNSIQTDTLSVHITPRQRKIVNLPSRQPRSLCTAPAAPTIMPHYLSIPTLPRTLTIPNVSCLRTSTEATASQEGKHRTFVAHLRRRF
jgi:hypothetical protein